jgi:hypothetical protein
MLSSASLPKTTTYSEVDLINSIAAIYRLLVSAENPKPSTGSIYIGFYVALCSEG